MTEAKSSTPAKKTAVFAKSKHDATVNREPNPVPEQGGRVVARCSCGWTASDQYTRDRFEPSVRAVVQEAADRHEKEPETD
jgi:hypothetical protein